MYFTFLSSSVRIFCVVELRRRTSWSARPRLLTSSMLRSDSVVAPASAFVSATITRLDRLDSPAENRAQPAEHRDREEKRRRDRPVDVVCVDHDEDHADEAREDDVHERGDELLGVAADLLEFAKCLTATLVLEDLERQRERVTNSVGIELRAQSLRYDVDEVVLEVLGDAGDEGDPDGHAEQERDSAEELRVGVLFVLCRVVVDDVTENQRVQQREDLVDRRENQREDNQMQVATQVSVEESHGRNIRSWEGHTAGGPGWSQRTTSSLA